MTKLGMSVFIDDLVGLVLRVFGTTDQGSIITRLFTILKEKKQIQKLMAVA
jgi:hypothetical protein